MSEIKGGSRDHADVFFHHCCADWEATVANLSSVSHCASLASSEHSPTCLVSALSHLMGYLLSAKVKQR